MDGRLSRNARGILVACTVGAALVGALGLAFGEAAVAAGGLVASTAFFGAFALYLIVTERRRHESAEDELQAQASFLESLVDSIGAVSSTLDANAILERTCEELEIPLLDPTDALRIRLEAGEVVYDDHWTPAGHAVIAGALAGHLANVLE